MGRWWLFGNAEGPRNAALAGEGSWPQAFVAYSSARFAPVLPSAAPPEWMNNQIPLSGDYMPVSKAFFANNKEKTILQATQIGPYNQDPARAAALQAGLAASLRALQ